MSLGFEANRSVVGHNEPISLVVVARNDSSSAVKEMNIEIKQKISWSASMYNDHRKRTMASIKVSGSQLGELQRASPQGHERGRSPTAIADAARNELQEMLKAGAGTKYELVLPDDCPTTMQTSLINVRHALVVELKTPTFVTSPEAWMPLRVQNNATSTSPDGFVAEESVAYATPVEAGTIENPVSLSVPSSAVIIEYNSNVPNPSAPEKF